MARENGEIAKFNVIGQRALVDLNHPDEGYCVYLYWNDDSTLAADNSYGLETTDVYYTYGVLTYMKFRFPVIENILRIPIFSRTNRMYYFG